ncbi:hypothetical protein HPG69_017527 [Diceros bicornis minor]|uniref:LSM domain-containing protein n=1 Tax=Diceros bicornis minor TaxID=77932 RepID=A0A7J7EDI7_DICBM|nr:hypothetical protein HPG69_017527 [Diceros bicornis minor]
MALDKDEPEHLPLRSGPKRAEGDVQPINLVFRHLQKSSWIQVWLQEQGSVQTGGWIVGSDEYVNLGLADAEETHSQDKSGKQLVGSISGKPTLLAPPSVRTGKRTQRGSSPTPARSLRCAGASHRRPVSTKPQLLLPTQRALHTLLCLCT